MFPLVCPRRLCGFPREKLQPCMKFRQGSRSKTLGDPHKFNKRCHLVLTVECYQAADSHCLVAFRNSKSLGKERLVGAVRSELSNCKGLEIRAKPPFTGDKRLGTVVRRSSPATGSSTSPMSLSLGSPLSPSHSTILSSRGVDLPDVGSFH